MIFAFLPKMINRITLSTYGYQGIDTIQWYLALYFLPILLYIVN